MADSGFLTIKNAVNHGVKQVHVRTIFLGSAGIVFGIFLGISPRAESFISCTRQNYRYDTPVVGGFAKSHDDFLDGLGGV